MNLNLVELALIYIAAAFVGAFAGFRFAKWRRRR